MFVFAVYDSSGRSNISSIVLLSVAVLFLGLQPVSSAPTSDQDWWINPCNRQPLLRHSRSAAESQLKRFLLEMKPKFFNKLADLYKDTDNGRLNGSCPRINNMLSPIKSASNFTMATQAFYETLLQFAVFVDRLRDTEIKTLGEFNHSRRKHIFEQAKENLRLLICEFNETLTKEETKENINRGIIRSSKPMVPKINMKCLPRSMDQSHAHVMDIDFFKKLQKFLKRSRMILRTKKKGVKGGKKGGAKKGKRTKKANKKPKH